MNEELRNAIRRHQAVQVLSILRDTDFVIDDADQEFLAKHADFGTLLIILERIFRNILTIPFTPLTRHIIWLRLSNKGDRIWLEKKSSFFHIFLIAFDPHPTVDDNLVEQIVHFSKFDINIGAVISLMNITTEEKVYLRLASAANI